MCQIVFAKYFSKPGIDPDVVIASIGKGRHGSFYYTSTSWHWQQWQKRSRSRQRRQSIWFLHLPECCLSSLSHQKFISQSFHPYHATSCMALTSAPIMSLSHQTSTRTSLSFTACYHKSFGTRFTTNPWALTTLSAITVVVWAFSVPDMLGLP